MKKINLSLKRGFSDLADEIELKKKIKSENIPVPRANRSMFGVKVEGLEKRFLIFLQFFRCLSLSHIKGFLSDDEDMKYTIIDCYVVAWLVILLLLLFLNTLYPLLYFIVGFVLLSAILTVGSGFWWLTGDIVGRIVLLLGLTFVGIVLWRHPSYFIGFIVVYRLIDIFSAQVGIIFIDRLLKNGGIRSLNRSLLLLGINYFEIIVGFAIMYLATCSIGYSNCNNIIMTPTKALYFSAVTITTLGCSDMKPVSSCGMTLAALEPILGLILIVLVIGAFFTFYARK